MNTRVQCGRSHTIPDSTYNAVLRRSGVYTSLSAGPIDFNQELAEPVQKSMATGWNQTMTVSTSRLLGELKTELLTTCNLAVQTIVTELGKAGVPQTRLDNTSAQVCRSIKETLTAIVGETANIAKDEQREISRVLAPNIQEQMGSGYGAALEVQRGSGTFNRMKSSIEGHADASIKSIYAAATQDLLDKVKELVVKLGVHMHTAFAKVESVLRNAFSAFWEVVLGNPEEQRQLELARNAAIPKLQALMDQLNTLAEKTGVAAAREDDEVGLMDVVDPVERRREEAKKADQVITISSDDDDDAASAAAPNCTVPSLAHTGYTIKPEPAHRSDLTFKRAGSPLAPVAPAQRPRQIAAPMAPPP